MTDVNSVLLLFHERGAAAYFGEPVTQTEHALQSAWQASRAGAPDALVAAALLHDVGHLLHQRGEDVADQGIDARHEIIGVTWLSRVFPPAVTQPIRLHVAAKRYLCGVDPEYAAALSPASQQSLLLQGGPFSAAEAELFRNEPYADAAIQLRRWDDAAKIPDLKVEPLESYRALLRRLS